MYLLHFDHAYKHAGHYLGWSTNIGHRIAQHRQGKSRCKLTKVAAEAGIQMTLARTWVGADRTFEAHLKNHYKNNRRLCPICKAREKETE